MSCKDVQFVWFWPTVVSTTYWPRRHVKYQRLNPLGPTQALSLTCDQQRKVPQHCNSEFNNRERERERERERQSYLGSTPHPQFQAVNGGLGPGSSNLNCNQYYIYIYILPRKLTWNLKSHAFERETHLPNLHFQVQAVSFRGSIVLLVTGILGGGVISKS